MINLQCEKNCTSLFGQMPALLHLWGYKFNLYMWVCLRSSSPDMTHVSGTHICLHDHSMNLRLPYEDKKIFIGVLGLGKLWLCGFVLLRCRYTAVWSSWPHCCFRLPLSLLYRSHFHKAYMHVAPDHQHPAPLWPWWGQSKEDGWNI